MKKTLLFAAAALFATGAFAADYYVIGAGVNGQEWVLKAPDAKMTDKGNGIYEWNGQTLADMFKINDGTWDDGSPNFGNNGSRISLGVAYSYSQGGGDIAFNGFGTVTNPKVVLDTNNQTITLTGDAKEIDPSEITYYIVGDNVNGQEWALKQADAAFTPQGNGIYRWEGTTLGTGFKINDGTWGAINLGSPGGAEISMNVPYQLFNNGNSGNISFSSFTLLRNPVVELNMNDETVTLIGGTPEGSFSWYITGINGEYKLTDDWILTETGEDTGIFKREVTVVQMTGKCKISDTGWSHQYGTNFPEEIFIDPANMFVMLDAVEGEGGDIEYELEEGVYTVIFDLNELTLEFKNGSDNSVDMVVTGEDNEVYYNLHGQRVTNPDRGIFIRVQNGKALKVVK